jgi:NADH-quinone oxidoreductase subunit L
MFATPSAAAAVSAALLPFLAFGLIMTLLRGRPHLAAGVSIAAVSVSLVCALWLLVGRWQAAAPTVNSVQWVVSGPISVPIGVLMDPLSLLMLTIVAAICFLVQVYSLGYMAGDPGFGRYYGFMSLFAWAMISLTLSSSLLQLYVFWELVGLSSYLLIGFWYEKFSASEAGKKAFVMTRTGDVAFFLGILLVLLHLGNVDILTLNSAGTAARMSPALLTLAVLLIFGGIIGKSAQFPLLTWLPDAMEGPTPVSALLHSATMVAAGVYLFARLFPFFSLSPTAMTVCLAIGTISMLLSSTMAMVSRDIKQVWAYSTISQLGFMIMGLSAGSYFAGAFHLTTHAGFKALLFLCSGVFIHHFGSNDMTIIGEKGGRRLKIPMVCMILGAAALSGLPPLSGFFSKEAILSALAGLDNPIWLTAGLAGVLLTAYYSFRLIFIILFPRAEASNGADPAADDGHHARGGYWVMAVPLVVLTLVTVVLGFGHKALLAYLTAPTAPAPAGGEAHLAWLPRVALGLALAGLVLAWLEFGRPHAKQVGFAERVAFVKDLFAQRWYMDHFYRWFLDTVIYRGVSHACTQNDRRVIDGGVDGLAQGTVESGRRLSLLQAGLFQYRLMVIMVVMALVSLYFFI